MDDQNKEKQIKLEVEPSKIKLMKKITGLAKAKDEDSMDDLAEAVRLILSKNKTGFKVPAEFIDELDYDQLNNILTAYFEWLRGNQNSPN